MKITGRFTRPVTQILLNNLKPAQASFRLHKNRIMPQSKDKIDYATEIKIMQHSKGKIVTQQKLKLQNTSKVRLIMQQKIRITQHSNGKIRDILKRDCQLPLLIVLVTHE